MYNERAKEKNKELFLLQKGLYFYSVFCNVSFLQIPAYILVAFLFCWGIWLTYYKQKTNNTFFKLRFGLWVWGFLAVSLLTMLLNFTYTIFYSALMFLHILICFLYFTVCTQNLILISKTSFIPWQEVLCILLQLQTSSVFSALCLT